MDRLALFSPVHYLLVPDADSGHRVWSGAPAERVDPHDLRAELSQHHAPQWGLDECRDLDDTKPGQGLFCRRV
jgi:hypothetical protein